MLLCAGLSTNDHPNHHGAHRLGERACFASLVPEYTLLTGVKDEGTCRLGSIWQLTQVHEDIAGANPLYLTGKDASQVNFCIKPRGGCFIGGPASERYIVFGW